MLTFDAELAPTLLAEQFTDVEVERWDAPLLDLPTREAVRDYLIGKGVEPARARPAAQSTEVPLSVTKRGPSRSRASPERTLVTIGVPDRHESLSAPIDAVPFGAERSRAPRLAT